ncbi:hypothetical protein F5Y15DRAFT_407039 [Xylariaceae sp. FL0016]|nr:hypothetical protein F5Y15DRAFT_407039 [Xylariaceae sp. FL0016]
MASYSEAADEVAEDFRMALEDLQSNTRMEISNLTLIARENTEHALAISGVLTDHVKKVAPHKKLPVLYLVDSIAKNVGTPYTLFFGRKLYSTFMEAYAMVDMPTRRKMEEMLKTWKEPVPGSIDTRPVFPPDVVRPIENALLKVRNTAVDMRSQQYGRGRPMPGVPYRETPTPPGVRPNSQAHGFSAPPPMPPQTNGMTYGQPTPTSYQPQPNYAGPSRSTPQPMPAPSSFQPPRQGGYNMSQAGISIDALNDDIEKLIAVTKQTLHDPTSQTRLKLLMDLQTVLQTQNLPQDQLVLVKKQITDLAVTIRAHPAQTHTPVPAPQPVAVAPPPAATPKVSLDSLLGPGALAALMARNSATPQASTPQPPPPTAAIRSPTPHRAEPQKAAAPTTDPMALMNMLRSAGMLPATKSVTGSTPVPSATPSVPLPFHLPAPPVQSRGPATLESLTSDISLKASSLKQFRPHLLPLLFESQGPQCTQCGRRFTRDEEGKKKKTAHMDWHFSVNRRIADAEKRGQHRSWLVDEMDWINTREIVDKDHVTLPGDADKASGGLASKAPKIQYIPVPDDPVLAASVCPICQEKFETKWLDDAQDFVWDDATQVGDRIYHASCHREATRDGGGTPLYTRNTPEPLLGKRKAEDELTSMRGKIKLEAA